eukprot:TRINITY_DN35920_c0_g1_i1.p2 TRINITY_DN35920_c0_g1~~TRINITY_DN35920_c0_g1_i1.p2  ORF type:complete len:105 (+),score=12.17 TRINITY_DN35920_c0_g1_i1:386-700(+)
MHRAVETFFRRMGSAKKCSKTVCKVPVGRDEECKWTSAQHSAAMTRCAQPTRKHPHPPALAARTADAAANSEELAGSQHHAVMLPCSFAHLTKSSDKEGFAVVV